MAGSERCKGQIFGWEMAIMIHQLLVCLLIWVWLKLDNRSVRTVFSSWLFISLLDKNTSIMFMMVKGGKCWLRMVRVGHNSGCFSGLFTSPWQVCTVWSPCRRPSFQTCSAMRDLDINICIVHQFQVADHQISYIKRSSISSLIQQLEPQQLPGWCQLASASWIVLTAQVDVPSCSSMWSAWIPQFLVMQPLMLAMDLHEYGQNHPTCQLRKQRWRSFDWVSLNNPGVQNNNPLQCQLFIGMDNNFKNSRSWV